MAYQFYYRFMLLLLLLSGCAGARKLTYFNDIAAATGIDSLNRHQQLRVQSGDVLQIVITTFDKEVSQILNPNAGSSSAANGLPDPGYLVDSAGYINLPVAGKLHVQGKTTGAINDEVSAALGKTIKNAYVSTRLVNFKVSVLGDVARPGSFRIGTERASLLDALSMAGDLNPTAVRNDVMLIREVNGVKSYTSINLNDSKTLTSPYYYLTNNDIIYVKPGPNKLFPQSRTVQLLPVILSAISLVTTIILLSK
jgi:polysaccharide export outer membrane protein